MDRFEEAVLEYVSANPDCLLKSHFKIPYDKEKKIGGSLPDFVVVNFKEKCVYIIEVTTAWNIRSVMKKVDARKTRWFEPIKQSEVSWAKMVSNWNFRVCLFLREDAVGRAKTILAEGDDKTDNVSIKSLDSVLLPWKDWNWDKKSNTPINLMR